MQTASEAERQTLEQQLPCNKLLLTGKIADKESWMRMGAEITEPGYVVLYNTVLASEMYRKVILTTRNTFCVTTAPVSIVLGTNKWRIWQLGKRNNVYIGYNPESRDGNGWWDNLTKALGDAISVNIPQMFGPLVVFAMADAISYSELELRRELINFMVMRYRHGGDYKFL